MDQKTENRLRNIEQILDDLSARVEKLEAAAQERFGDSPFEEESE